MPRITGALGDPGKPGHVNHFADYLLDIKRTVALALDRGRAHNP